MVGALGVNLFDGLSYEGLGDALGEQGGAQFKLTPARQGGFFAGEGGGVAQVVHEALGLERFQDLIRPLDVTPAALEGLPVDVAAAILPAGAQGFKPLQYLFCVLVHQKSKPSEA